MKLKATDYLYTASGRKIYLPKIKLSDIDLYDIAYGLAGIYRFNGQSRVSVLRHSMAVSYYCESPISQLVGLLHDAAEAYMMDVPVPLKPYMTDQWLDDYERVEALICKKFKLPDIDSKEWEEVRRIDKQLVAYEMEALKHTDNNKMRYPLRARIPKDINEAYLWGVSDENLIPRLLFSVHPIHTLGAAPRSPQANSTASHTSRS